MFVGLVILVFALIGLEFYLIFRLVEHWWCLIIKKQIPYMASDKKLRRAVASYIQTYCPNAKSVCEIGAGYGWLARYVGRCCNIPVVALENMPFTFFLAKLFQIFPGGRWVSWVRCDAFDYLKNYKKKFDVGIAYLGPVVNDRLVDVLDKFGVLIVLDVPITGKKPFQVVDLGSGCTRYGRLKFPHKLFVYKK